MQCKNCGYLVPHDMKFALMQNFCPKCGNKLFSNQEKNDISMICTRLSSRIFAKDMSEELIHDIGLFVYDEVKSGFGQVILDRKIQAVNAKKDPVHTVTEEVIEEPIIQKEPVIETNTNSLDYKRKIREEEMARVMYSHEEEGSEAEEDEEDFHFDEDPDDKVRRLQELAKKVNITKNKPIRRLSD